MSAFFEVFKACTLTFSVLAGFLFGYKTPRPAAYYSPEEIAAYTEAAKEACGGGMAVLIGGGFDTEENFRPLIDACMNHVNKEQPHMLFIPTAHFDRLEDPEDIINWFENAGCVSDILLVSQSDPAEVAEKIAWADIIYETGGNLDFLTRQWKEKGVNEAVKAAFDRGAALIGVSSGAMCWAERGWDDFGEETTRVIGSFPFIGKAGAYEYRDCAGIVPFCVCPHFDNTGWRMFAYEAIKLDIPSLAIENGAAVVYENGEYRVISDRAHPLRTAYVFQPEKRIVMADVKTTGGLASVLDGEHRTNK